MNITIQQLKLLENYRDRCYVMNILLQEHSDFYSFVNHCFSIPLIITSSIMTVINSSFNPDDMRIPNIILNASTSLLLSLVGNFKFLDRVNNFGSVAKKMNSLCHVIEDKVVNIDIENVSADTIRSLIKDYDDLLETVNYPYLNRIKDKIKKKFEGKKCLPNCLNCSGELIPNSPLTTPTTKKKFKISKLGSSMCDVVIQEN